MSKSVYSLVLRDEIVEKLDRLAYSRNTNRSSLINQILAEYVSYVTPEKRMRDIFDRLEDLLRGGVPGCAAGDLRSSSAGALNVSAVCALRELHCT